MGSGNGGGIGEKMNDPAVADRQKRNRTSWSLEESVALAALECLKINNEWFQTGEIEFRLAA